MRRYAKAFLALAGGLTPAALVGILALAGVHVDPTVMGGICTALAAAAVRFGPANAPPPQADPTPNSAADRRP
jgi:hypothetical protein